MALLSARVGANPVAAPVRSPNWFNTANALALFSSVTLNPPDTMVPDGLLNANVLNDPLNVLLPPKSELARVTVPVLA